MQSFKKMAVDRACIVLLLLLALIPAWGVLPVKKRQLEDFDKRSHLAEKRLPESKKEASRRLMQMAPDMQVDWDPVLGTPHWVRNEKGFLTEKGGVGKAVSKAVADQIPVADPDRSLKAFLNEHKALFGHSASALTGARKKREFVGPNNGLRT